MNYLIFRTDRIGDFLIISTLIKAIKRNKPESKVFIVASKKNAEFIKKNHLVDKVFLLRSKKISDRIKLLLELRKYKFDNIIVSDKKNRSIIFTLLLKSKNKIFNVSKYLQKKFLNIFYRNVFIDNDKIINQSTKDVLSKNCKSLKLSLEEEDFHYLNKDQFKTNYSHSNLLDLKNLKFIIFHYDEKWEIKNYAKFFKKATSFTDISINKHIFKNFLFDLSKKTSQNIIITTGTIETNLLNEFKNFSKKLSESLYEFDLDNLKAYLFVNEDFYSISHLISKSSQFISCHGAFTHIASNYKIKILDIIERNKITHYGKITNNMKNYKSLYRDNFKKLSKDIIKYS